MTAQAKITETAQPALRPGERMLAGKPYVFNQGLLNDHLAREAVAAAPRYLGRASEAELRNLHTSLMRDIFRHDAEAQGLLRRVMAEITARGLRGSDGSLPAQARQVA